MKYDIKDMILTSNSRLIELQYAVANSNPLNKLSKPFELPTNLSRLIPPFTNPNELPLHYHNPIS